MKIFQSKKIFLAILVFSFFFNFLPLGAESNFKPPILDSTNLAFNGPVNANSFIHAIAIKGSTIYVGGEFTKIGETERNHLAAIGPDGALQDWNPRVSGSDNEDTYIAVHAIAIRGSTIYIGGVFTTVGRTERNSLAAIGIDGTLKSWNPNVSWFGSAYVNHIIVSGSTIYIGGQFNKIEETERHDLAAIGTDGSLKSWDPHVIGKGNKNEVDVLAINGSTIYAGGSFTTIGRKQRNNLAAIKTNGVLQNWNPNVAGAFVSTLAINSSTIYVGGYFTKTGETERNNLAAVGTDGTLKTWNPNVDGFVKTLVISGSMLYVGGDFTAAGNESRSNFASFSIPKSD